MNSSRRTLVHTFLSLAVIASPFGIAAQSSQAPGLLSRTEAAAVLPEKVFYRGQSATVQGRNSAGIRIDGGKLALFAIVDTSGYSSAVQQTYQAYLLTEVPLKINDKTLQPGSYGFGFIAGDKMVVMDIGANELMRTNTTHDAAFARPTPLQLTADVAAPGHYRLYLGRNYVTVSAAK
jgi:hypothetical protein